MSKPFSFNFGNYRYSDDIFGAELITLEANRVFSSDTGYWLKTGTTAIAAGVCNIKGTTSQGILHSTVVTIGKKYRLKYTIKTVRSGSIHQFVGATFGVTRNTPGIYIDDIVCNVAAQFGVFAASAGTDIDIDDISLTEVL